MPLRIVEISADDKASKDIEAIAKDHEAVDYWHSARNKDGRRTTSILVHLNRMQDLTDEIQSRFNKEKNWRVNVIPVEASIPKPEEPEDKKGVRGQRIVRGTITREELYDDVEKGAQLDLNFVLLVLLSGIVAAIGLISDNITVIIGAMVIAPLLGPNLALAFGAALGDHALMVKAVRCNAAGLGMTLACGAFMGFMLSRLMGIAVDSTEVMARTHTGFDVVILALASGAAAVLSITTGLSGAMVGVMVAVALLPPAVVLGLMLGAGHFPEAYGAGLLLLTNIVCISLVAQTVFFARGIKPRTWYMRRKSKQSLKANAVFWGGLLALLSLLIILRGI